MVELVRSNDPVLISYICALLVDAEIEPLVLDQHTSVLEGSIGAIPRRIMVASAAAWRARSVLAEAGLAGHCRDYGRR